MTPALAETIRQILGRIPFGTLATASVGARPWNSPVIMVHDAELNFFWFSDSEAQHSRNIAVNPHVFIVFYDSTAVVGRGQLDRGLYLEARAEQVTSTSDIRHALSLRQDRTPASVSDFQAPFVRRVYRAVLERAWVNDIEKHGGKFLRNVRVELDLGDLRRTLS